jgi:hypothetical protein
LNVKTVLANVFVTELLVVVVMHPGDTLFVMFFHFAMHIGACGGEL